MIKQLIDKDAIRQQFLSDFGGLFDKEGKMFCALVTNKGYNAAFEKALQSLISEATIWVNGTKLYNKDGESIEGVQTGEQLMLSNKALSFITYYQEGEEVLRRKLRAIFYRTGDSVWGCVKNIENVFRDYFDSSAIWVIEDTVEYDSESSGHIVENGDFLLMDGWTSDNAIADSKSRFSGAFGAKLGSDDSKGSVEQSVTLQANKVYALHFMARAEGIGATVSKDGTVIGSVATNNGNLWRPYKVLFEAVEAGEYTITFEGRGAVDYVRVFEKPCYPTFTVLVQQGAKDAATNKAVVTADSEEGGHFVNYSRDKEEVRKHYNDNDNSVIEYFETNIEGDNWQQNASDYHYYKGKKDNGEEDNSDKGASYFVDNGGSFEKQAYTDLLDCVRPCGVQGFIEFVHRGEGQD